MKKPMVRIQSCLQLGFTLLELMVVVAIIGILSAIAMPMYTEYMQRGKVAEATSTLGAMHTKAKQYYADNRQFDGMDAAAFCGNWGSGTTYFTYACTVPRVAGEVTPIQTYSITATGVASQGVGGFTYTVTEQGVRSSTAWGRNSASCWIASKGSSC